MSIKSGERFSFYTLLKNYSIIVPIIQRDYAQGRNSKEIELVRISFIKALFDYLKNDNINQDLDFIYGTQKNSSEHIELLDGQQRLTTLFLLHWYLAIRSSEKLREQYLAVVFKDKKSQFSYETRLSSSEFCNLLCHCLKEGLKIDKEFENLSGIIEDIPKFYLSWKHDPTIASMLTMLDTIHNIFTEEKYDANTFFEKLLDEENPSITFLFLPLENFNLDDELYIKMNSRGKNLSDFENFKAKFLQFIEKDEDILAGEKTKLEELKKIIDHDWTDIFWEYRDENKNFDHLLMNFINFIFISQYIWDNDDIENLPALLKIENPTFFAYEKLGAVTKNSVLYLIKSLESIKEIKNNKIICSEEYKYCFSFDNVFRNAREKNFTNNTERLQFDAFLRFLIANNNEREKLDPWMRVIYNLTENSRVDDNRTFSQCLRGIKGLLEDNTEILKHISDTNNSINGFSGSQIREERIKAQLMRIDNEWQKCIIKIEKHEKFKGKIGFILEFSGIMSYSYENKNCNWSEEDNIKFKESFDNYANKAVVIFNLEQAPEYLLSRAVFTKGDYTNSDHWGRKNMLTKESRDYSWKRLLRLPKSENDKLSEKRELLKSLFDDELYDSTNIEESLNCIIKSYQNNGWSKKIIGNPKLIDVCKQGFLYHKDDKVFLYGSSQRNHYHYELNTYDFYTQIIESEIDKYTNYIIWYGQSKSSSDIPCICFIYKLNDKNIFELRIYYDKRDKENINYKIVIIQMEMELEKQNKFKEYLEENDFKQVDEKNEYYKEIMEEGMEILIKKYTSELNNLLENKIL